ncbi:hypothetical protein D3C76_1503910 [compost metagenome]|uniref:YgaP family membrane protein n=1 Tax=Pseudomonas TaxID=286 RepID=UPI0005EAFEE6|nr:MULTISPECIES: DUF2892 domain-containing protein [Pseudomonas]KJK06175.1 hypothetical protein UB47_17930 [Pseudomonas sp. 5]MDD1975198.1 DUF2892 domain-containing protein [Pseudomonas putida]QYX49961.1 DUF2892 domain-containing protein [Pseudomonas sp. S11A 273]
MSANKTLIPALQDKPEHNVQGWERATSVAGGVIMVSKGMRRGGLFGLIQVAIGGVALARGITGHSSLKSLLERGRSDLDQLRSTLERNGAELQALRASADAATRSATVTGNDSLKNPTP